MRVFLSKLGKSCKIRLLEDEFKVKIRRKFHIFSLRIGVFSIYDSF